MGIEEGLVRNLIRLILNADHLAGALGEALRACRHRLFIATADVKDLHMGGLMPGGRAAPQGTSILEVFEQLSRNGIETRLLHSGVPSGALLGELKERGRPALLHMRRCVRLHAKAVVADGRWMYLGSANLTGAGLGAKSPRRRNFEAGIWTDELSLIDPVLDMLDNVWSGNECTTCGRKDYCPVPLEEPRL